MRKRLMLVAAALALTLGQPQHAFGKEESSCEDICGEQAAGNCEDIDTFKCAMYIIGCLVGCSVEKLVS